MFKWIILIFIIAIILYVIKIYNTLIITRNRVRDQFSQIDVHLKQRTDLLPNLVEIVKGYTNHENEVIKKIIEARNKYLSSKSKQEKVLSFFVNGV